MSSKQAILNEQYQTALTDRRASDARYEAAMEAKRPFMLLRPSIYPDGNMWCVLLGANIQEGVCGFGETPEKAAVAFDLAWLNGRCGPKARAQQPSPDPLVGS